MGAPLIYWGVRASIFALEMLHGYATGMTFAAGATVVASRAATHASRGEAGRWLFFRPQGHRDASVRILFPQSAEVVATRTIARPGSQSPVNALIVEESHRIPDAAHRLVFLPSPHGRVSDPREVARLVEFLRRGGVQCQREHCVDYGRLVAPYLRPHMTSPGPYSTQQMDELLGLLPPR